MATQSSKRSMLTSSFSTPSHTYNISVDGSHFMFFFSAWLCYFRNSSQHEIQFDKWKCRNPFCSSRREWYLEWSTVRNVSVSAAKESNTKFYIIIKEARHNEIMVNRSILYVLCYFVIHNEKKGHGFKLWLQT